MLISENLEISDEWIKKREDKMTKLQQCQKSNNLKSCLSCEKIIGCEIRKEYVKSVYESMNKGGGGGFEF